MRLKAFLPPVFGFCDKSMPALFGVTQLLFNFSDTPLIVCPDLSLPNSGRNFGEFDFCRKGLGPNDMINRAGWTSGSVFRGRHLRCLKFAENRSNKETLLCGCSKICLAFKHPNQTSSLKAAVKLPRPSLTKVRSVINLIVRHLGQGVGGGQRGRADCALQQDLTSKSLEARYQIISSHDNHLRKEVANISSGGRAGVWVSRMHSLLRTRPQESSQSAATTQRAHHFSQPVSALPTLHQPAASDQSEGCKNEHFVHNKKL